MKYLYPFQTKFCSKVPLFSDSKSDAKVILSNVMENIMSELGIYFINNKITLDAIEGEIIVDS